MKILVFTQYFYPEPFRINDLCSELVRRGHEVTVVTGYPNYPGGKTYEGYGWFKKYDTEWNGVKVKRIPVFSRGKSAVHMFMNMFSYVFSGYIWSMLNREKYDIAYVFEVSPVTVALPAVFYKKIHKIPVIMNVQDLWPENVEVVLGINNKCILAIIDKIVDYIYAHCDLLLVSSKSFKSNIVARGHENHKVKTWYQFCPPPGVSKADSVKPDEYDDKFKVVFTGNIGYAQGIKTALEAAKLVNNKEISWYFVGDGRAKEEMMRIAEEYGLTNVYFTGRKPYDDIPHYLYHANCALLTLDDNKVFNMTIPAKIQTYLSCGCPVVASANGEIPAIINEAQCGIVVEAGSAMRLAQAVEKLYEKSEEERQLMSQNALKYYEKNYTMKLQVDKLLGYIEKLL